MVSAKIGVEDLQVLFKHFRPFKRFRVRGVRRRFFGALSCILWVVLALASFVGW